MIAEIIYNNLPAHCVVENIYWLRRGRDNFIFLQIAPPMFMNAYRFITNFYIGKLFFEVGAVSQDWLNEKQYPTEVYSVQEMDNKLNKLQLLG